MKTKGSRTLQRKAIFFAHAEQKREGLDFEMTSRRARARCLSVLTYVMALRSDAQRTRRSKSRPSKEFFLGGGGGSRIVNKCLFHTFDLTLPLTAFVLEKAFDLDADVLKKPAQSIDFERLFYLKKYLLTWFNKTIIAFGGGDF
jgi:hypothetical protein